MCSPERGTWSPRPWPMPSNAWTQRFAGSSRTTWVGPTPTGVGWTRVERRASAPRRPCCPPRPPYPRRPPRCAPSIGAGLAGAPAPFVGALREFGSGLGLAFQAVDDRLGIWGHPHVTGKPVGNDLRQRKKTLPVVAALSAGGRDAEELQALLA